MAAISIGLFSSARLCVSHSMGATSLRTLCRFSSDVAHVTAPGVFTLPLETMWPETKVLYDGILAQDRMSLARAITLSTYRVCPEHLRLTDNACRVPALSVRCLSNQAAQGLYYRLIDCYTNLQVLFIHLFNLVISALQLNLLGWTIEGNPKCFWMLSSLLVSPLSIEAAMYTAVEPPVPSVWVLQVHQVQASLPLLNPWACN
jgi:hypothetical protein